MHNLQACRYHDHIKILRELYILLLQSQRGGICISFRRTGRGNERTSAAYTSKVREIKLKSTKEVWVWWSSRDCVNVCTVSL